MRAVALLSGGIDSPVAAYLMARNGVELVALHMDGAPYFEADARVIKLVARLRELTGQAVPLFVAPHGVANLSEIERTRVPNIRCVLCKRFMMRTAEALAKREGCEAIVMGDSLGQVASQTLKNIRVEQQAVSIPIIRPLIGMDKDQIIRVARDIGTYEISILGAGPCGMVPAKPSTEARLRRILEAEAEMDVGAMVGKALAGMRKY